MENNCYYNVMKQKLKSTFLSVDCGGFFDVISLCYQSQEVII